MTPGDKEIDVHLNYLSTQVNLNEEIDIHLNFLSTNLTITLSTEGGYSNKKMTPGR